MNAPSAAVRRTSAVGLALAVCVTALPATASAPMDSVARRGGADTPGPGLDRYYNQRPHWRSCVLGPDDRTGKALKKAGAHCADVSVPLDYDDPDGRTITIAMSRIKATDTDHRVGSLLLNVGGPGDPSLAGVADVRKAMKDVGARYDIVGVDPRFVGRSTPLDCEWPVSSPILAPGKSRADFDRQVALHKKLAAKCRATNGDVLPHITTRNAARDMDVVRGVLGERKISYLGYSYGTYLGTVYSQMFPGRYDRLVLDGGIDPRRYSPRFLHGTADENERALAAFATWAAKRHDTYGLGRTRAQVLATLEHAYDVSARRGLTVGTGRDAFRLDETHVPTLFYRGLADDTDEARAAFGQQMALLAKAADGRPTRVPPEFKEMIEPMTTGSQSQAGSVQTAILCGDKAAPRDPERYWRDIRRSRAAHPITGPLTNNIGPCAFWDRPSERPTQVRHDTPALLVGATGDPRTDYEGAVALRDTLGDAKLITLKGAHRHTVYATYGNACVDDKVNAYLATGTLPAKDQTCVKRDA